MIKDFKIIKKIDEITDINIKYTTFNRENKFFEIKFDKEYGYFITGYVCGDSINYVSNNFNIKFWKTFNGVKRAIKRFTKKGYWGFGQWLLEE